ncbi:hypothetical protein OH802_06445 [Nocardioides sp. NBC_00850]|uniref:hypothetical protein n=1 Tax=Nocardioides sp. NBC_00850 TaxID=2976001 RepID=UPI00386BAC0B|nr:hypothetical protein OH802_06445 [Nocardioides sp. NBC_00850]
MDASDGAAMILIGYWRETLPEGGNPGMPAQRAADYERLRQQGLRWPDPVKFVDGAGDEEARRRTTRHLEVGTLVNQYRGISRCRLCEKDNGSAEMTDGTYCWPEGLAHYVRQHDVRLPEAFLRHVEAAAGATRGLPTPMFDEFGMRDRNWPGPEFADQLWKPASLDHGQAYVEVDADWWSLHAD